MRPENVRFTQTHEWIRPEGDTAYVGITDFAVSRLSDLVHLELPEVGDPVEQDRPFGEIESVKTVSDLVAPADGEVLAVNEAVLENPRLVAEDPFGRGWLIRIRLQDREAIASLMDARAYGEFVEAEEAGH
jgi:glycine cleavage system H protein